MGFRYPWSVLDIAPTNNEAAIRKAYAVKLKVTRPDEDPKGFQALREARDAALDESRYVNAARDVAEEPAEPVPVEARSEAPSALELPENTPVPTDLAAAAATVRIETIDPHDVTLVDDEPEIAELLKTVGTPHPWRDLAAQWAEVFDAMEADTLSNYGYNMWAVLPRLLEDVRRDRGQLPDVSEWGFDPSGNAQRLLGPYAVILRDFERRFGILQNDTFLLQYMFEDDARDFINALTIAVGRERAPHPSIRQVINVETIEQRYVEAAWADDLKMLDYYERAREKDEFPWSFSWVALLFPLPFALYYRLTGVALLAAFLVAANALFAVMRQHGAEVPFAPIAFTVYLITAGSLAFNWRRIRLNTLAGRVKKLKAAKLDAADIVERVRTWGRPARNEMWLGVVAILLAVAVRVLAR